MIFSLKKEGGLIALFKYLKRCPVEAALKVQHVMSKIYEEINLGFLLSENCHCSIRSPILRLDQFYIYCRLDLSPGEL